MGGYKKTEMKDEMDSDSKINIICKREVLKNMLHSMDLVDLQMALKQL